MTRSSRARSESSETASVLGVDPGRLRGTGLAEIVRIGQRWYANALDSGVMSAEAVVDWCDSIAEGGDELPPVAIETMRPMGPRSSNQQTLDNAEFIGEIIGRLEERGYTVVRLKKHEVLGGLGVKGKAPAKRVRQVVELVAGPLGKCSDHAVDAVAVAVVGARMVRRSEDQPAGKARN